MRLHSSARHWRSPQPMGAGTNYWHKRANGTDAHAMLVDEFVPLLIRKIGPLPFALHGYVHGRLRALLAAERGVDAAGVSFFKGVAASSPARLARAHGDRAGSIRRRPGLLRQRRLHGRDCR